MASEQITKFDAGIANDLLKKSQVTKLPKKYKFVVDCKEEYHKVVYAHMRNLGFEVDIEPSSLGDHYGAKRFSTPEEVETAANGLINKFTKEIYQIVVLPAR